MLRVVNVLQVMNNFLLELLSRLHLIQLMYKLCFLQTMSLQLFVGHHHTCETLTHTYHTHKRIHTCLYTDPVTHTNIQTNTHMHQPQHTPPPTHTLINTCMQTDPTQTFNLHKHTSRLTPTHTNIHLLQIHKLTNSFTYNNKHVRTPKH